MRRFAPGQTFIVADIALRIVPGRKQSRRTGEIDLVMQWRTEAGHWVPIPMRAAAVIVAFWFENEEVLYPPEMGFMGGEKFMEYLRVAVTDGWETAEAILQGEKNAKVVAA